MGNKGQSLVELGISFLILMFLLVGLVEFGIIFFQFVQLRDAAQEGALYGSTCDCAVLDITERALGASNTPIELTEDTRVSVVVTAKDRFGNPKDPEIACERDALTVQVSFAHEVFMPFLPQLLGVDVININADATDTVLIPTCP